MSEKGRLGLGFPRRGGPLPIARDAIRLARLNENPIPPAWACGCGVTSDESDQPDVRRLLVAAAILLVVLLAVFVPHLGNGFVYDDHAQIEHDPYVRGEGPWTAAFTQDVWANLRGEAGIGLGYYRPLFLVSNRVLASAGQGSALPFHLTGLLIHVACAAAAFALLSRLLGSRRLAFAGAALFSLHPAVGEGVYWAAALADQLSLAGFLTAALCLTASRSRTGAHRAALLAGATAGTLVALFSKETAVVVAPILTLEALRHAPGTRRLRLLETAPIWAVTFGFLAVRAHVIDAVSGGGTSPDPAWSVSRAGLALAWDVRHLLLPYPLSPFHDFRWESAGPGDVVGGIAVLGLLIALAVWTFRARPACLFWFGWIVLPLLPRLAQLFLERRTQVIVAERYLLMSLVPFCAGLAFVGAAGLRRWTAPQKRFRTGGAILAGVLLVGAVTTHLYGRAFANDRAYFTYAGERTRAHPIVLNGLATLEIRAGRHREALAYLDRALAIEPRVTQLHLNRGIALLEIGRPDLAVASIEKAISLDDSIVGAHLALARALRELGRTDEGARHVEAELRLDPQSVPARVDLGTMRYLAGDVAGAVDLWESALADAQGHTVLLFNLGMGHRALGNRARAHEFLLRFLDRADDRLEAQRQQAEEWLEE